MNRLSTLRPRRLARPHLLALAAMLALPAMPTLAAERSWRCGAGNLNNVSCWSLSGALLPTDDYLILNTGAIANFPGTAATDLTITMRNLSINSPRFSQQALALNITSGSLNITSSLNVGASELTVLNQSGGLLTVSGAIIGQSGFYDLRGGRIESAGMAIYGNTTVSQAGHLATGNLTVFATGTLRVDSASAPVQTAAASNLGRMILNNAQFTATGGLTNSLGGSLAASNSTVTGLERNSGGIRAENGLVTFAQSQALVSDLGSIAVSNLAEARFPAGIVNNRDSMVFLDGPQAVLSNGNTSAALVNSGRIGGSGSIMMPTTNHGPINIAQAGQLTFGRSYASEPGAEIYNEGQLRFNGPASFHNNAGIAFPGRTTFTSTVDVGKAGAAGLLTVAGSAALIGATYNVDILGTIAGSGYDQLVVGGELSFAAGTQLRLNSGIFIVQIGQQFNLFDWGTRVGTFSNVDSSGMRLAQGAVLNMSRLYVDGTLAVVAVPEPATWLSLGAGLLLIGARARRWRQEA